MLKKLSFTGLLSFTLFLFTSVSFAQTGRSPFAVGNIGNLSEVTTEEFSSNRDLIRQRAQEQMEQMKERALEAKKVPVQNKEMLESCKSNELQNQECQRVKAYSLENLKTQLLNHLDRLETRADELMQKMLTQGVASEEEISAVFNEYKLVLNQNRQKIEAAQTIEELRALFKSFNNQSHKDLMQKLSSFRMTHSYTALDNVLNMLSTMLARIEANIALAQQAGHDVTDVEAFVTAAQGKIAAAKDLMVGVNRANFDEAKAAFVEARELLRSAHEDLRRGLQLLKELYGEQSWEVS